jgi:hypothetical protein
MSTHLVDPAVAMCCAWVVGVDRLIFNPNSRPLQLHLRHRASRENFTVTSP